MEWPAIVQVQLMNNLNLNFSEYNLLMNIVFFPNIIVPFFSGILVDKFAGQRKLLKFLLIIVIIVVFSQLICIYGLAILSFWVVLLGRLLFGIV